MKVIIVGAGISGLSTAIALGKSGHNVVVLDSAPELAELGAGVQMTPQAIRYLFQWGLKDDLLAQSIVPEKFYVKHYEDGELLGTIPTGNMATDYGAPYILVHRAILHTILHKHAVNAGAEVRLSSKVTQYDFPNASLTLQNGVTLNADLIIAADGMPFPLAIMMANLTLVLRHQLICAKRTIGLVGSRLAANGMGCH